MTETATEALEGVTGEQDNAAVESAAAEIADAPKEKKDRAASLLATRKTKMDALFEGKKYVIAKEIHLEGAERFETPFGNKGRHGYALVLSEGTPGKDEEGADLPSKFIVGATMLDQIAKEYSAVDAPQKERKRRTKEQKAADDARELDEQRAKAERGE